MVAGVSVQTFPGLFATAILFQKKGYSQDVRQQRRKQLVSPTLSFLPERERARDGGRGPSGNGGGRGGTLIDPCGGGGGGGGGGG